MLPYFYVVLIITVLGIGYFVVIDPKLNSYHRKYLYGTTVVVLWVICASFLLFKGSLEQNKQKASQPTESLEVLYYDNGDGLAIISTPNPNDETDELLRAYTKWQTDHPNRYEHRTREDYEVISPGGYIYERIAIFYNAPADSLQNK